MANPKKPKIGVPRVYDTATCPVILPGEVAEAKIDLAELIRLIQEDPKGNHIFNPPIAGWTVEPVPGWHGRYLRIRYRVWGRWFSGKPKLEVDVKLVVEKEHV